jgi:uncharacterized membrane protein (UPF0136 family)
MKNNEIIKWAIISMLLPIGGIIGGIYYLVKGRGSEGAGIFIMGIFFWMFWAIIFGMV